MIAEENPKSIGEFESLKLWNSETPWMKTITPQSPKHKFNEGIEA